MASKRRVALSTLTMTSLLWLISCLALLASPESTDEYAIENKRLKLVTESTSAFALREYTKAEELLKQAVSLPAPTSELGENYYEMALSQLCGLYSQNKQYDKLKALLFKNIDDAKFRNGPISVRTHSALVNAYSSLPPGPDRESVQRQIDEFMVKFRATGALTEKCLALRESALRDLLPPKTGQLAILELKQALEVAEQLGPSRAELAWCLSELAAVKQVQGSLKEADGMLSQAIALVQKYRREYDTVTKYSAKSGITRQVDYSPSESEMMARRIDILNRLGQHGKADALSAILNRYSKYKPSPIVGFGFSTVDEWKTIPGVVSNTRESKLEALALFSLADRDLRAIRTYRDVLKQLQ